MVYQNALTADYRAALSARLKSLRQTPWVLTYDDCPQIRSLYSDWAAIHPFGLRNVAHSVAAQKSHPHGLAGGAPVFTSSRIVLARSGPALSRLFVTR